jgi:hypothetical protein
MSVDPTQIALAAARAASAGKSEQPAPAETGRFDELLGLAGAGGNLSMSAELALSAQFLSMMEGGDGKETGSGLLGIIGSGGLAGASDMEMLYRAVSAISKQSVQPSGIAEPVVAPQGPARPGETLAAVKAPGAEAADGSETGQNAGSQRQAARAYGGSSAERLLGMVSARFESGGDPGLIGHDRVGGTSYGVYQISSRAGTMDDFLDFLSRENPAAAERLASAGPADTGSRQGTMPEVWRSLAAEDPEGFAELQHKFILESHLMPAAKRIADETGVDVLSRGRALAEVLFSTAVQHGASGSASIFDRAVSEIGGLSGRDFDRELISKVYEHRSTQFGSSSEAVQSAVKGRLRREQELALSMLGKGIDASV